MSAALAIRWIECSPSLHEARVTLPDGTDTYVGYVAVSPGDDVWRGYVGVGFIPVGMGPYNVMRRVVEQRVAEALERTTEVVEVVEVVESAP